MAMLGNGKGGRLVFWTSVSLTWMASPMADIAVKLKKDKYAVCLCRWFIRLMGWLAIARRLSRSRRGQGVVSLLEQLRFNTLLLLGARVGRAFLPGGRRQSGI